MTDELDGPAAEFDESDLIPIATLEHNVHCPRAPLGLRANPIGGENRGGRVGKNLRELSRTSQSRPSPRWLAA